MFVALVHSAASAAFPAAAGLPGFADIDGRSFVRELLRRSPWTLWFGTVGSALAFQLLPLVTIGWPLPALLLPLGRRDAHAHAMATHRWYLVRMAMVMIKTVGGLHWGAHPQVRAALGMPSYPPDPQKWRDGQLQPQGGPP